MCNRLLNITTVTEYNNLLGVETLHPSVSVIDLSTTRPVKCIRYTINFYAVFLKGKEGNNPFYGQCHDCPPITVACLAPGQSVDMELIGVQGWALCFAPELVHAPPFRRDIREYSYFSHETNRQLLLSEQERIFFIDCLDKIRYELTHTTDRFSKRLIVTNIELLLDYCLRFYERQLVAKRNIGHDILTRFELLLDDYFATEKPLQNGLPTVTYCATKLFLSPNYFGSLVKKETGKSAREYIQFKVTGIAKERILHPDKTISQIAYELGFQYPQHFTRLFKKVVGQSPYAYREMHDEIPF